MTDQPNNETQRPDDEVPQTTPSGAVEQAAESTVSAGSPEGLETSEPAEAAAEMTIPPEPPAEGPSPAEEPAATDRSAAEPCAARAQQGARRSRRRRSPGGSRGWAGGPAGAPAAGAVAGAACRGRERSEGPAAAEVRDPEDEGGAGSEVMIEDRDGVVVEDTVWTLVQTSRFSNKSEARTGMAAFEVNFTP